MTLQLACFVSALMVFLIWDTSYWGNINHAVRQVVRTCVWGILALVIEDNWADRAMYFFAYHAAFGLPFDWAMNRLQGLNLLYIGDTAWSDRLGRKWPAAFWGLKVILFLIGMGTLVLGTYW